MHKEAEREEGAGLASQAELGADGHLAGGGSERGNGWDTREMVAHMDTGKSIHSEKRLQNKFLEQKNVFW